MKPNKLVKPQFLFLDQETKRNFFDSINNTNLDNNFKQIAQECLLFTGELAKRINNKDITFQQINKLFEDKIQAAPSNSIDPELTMLPESNNNINVNEKQKKKQKKKKPRENGGKYGYDDYSNSEIVIHDVEGVKPGDPCLRCNKGRYYYSESKKTLEIIGNPIVQVVRHKKPTLRCNCCGNEIFSNKKIVKWTNEAKSSIAIYKLYGTPLYRIAKLQKLFGIPVAANTLWEKYKEIHEDCAKFVVSELYRIAPESALLSTDDTGMRILEVMQNNKDLPKKEQRACHTTVMCFKHIQYKIVLYVSANRYCKENWKPLLEKRSSQEKLIIVSDASSQSFPTGAELEKSIPVGCLGNHGHRKFKDLENNYPEECQYFLNLIFEIYENDRNCKHYTSEQRLKYHQEKSQPYIDAIYTKITELFIKKIIEPNSDLGKAMNYWVNHKEKLTMFLSVAGCPLDNNWAEFELRIIALYRKTSMFFKTLNTAEINSNMFSLIATCEANNINSFAYLNWIQRNWKDVQANPAKYLPWNFKMDTGKITHKVAV